MNNVYNIPSPKILTRAKGNIIKDLNKPRRKRQSQEKDGKLLWAICEE
jgi:hypothetical protein